MGAVYRVGRVAERRWRRVLLRDAPDLRARFLREARRRQSPQRVPIHCRETAHRVLVMD
jgi:hypothetical protein